ncbi:MAG: hypothetical protein NDJ89_18710 [Oligoflexia bacterium]|nr:hypothetical protein [Oligoflexia bacterium]
MFRKWLKGASVEELCSEFGLGPSQVHRIKADENWEKYSGRRHKKLMDKAAKEAEREEDQSQRRADLVEHRGVRGEWIDCPIVYPEGTNAPPNLFADHSPWVETAPDEDRPNVVRVRSFFPGGYREPSRTWRIGTGAAVASAEGDGGDDSPGEE